MLILKVFYIKIAVTFLVFIEHLTTSSVNRNIDDPEKDTWNTAEQWGKGRTSLAPISY